MPDKSDHTISPGASPEPDILSHAAPGKLKFYGLAALFVAGAVVVFGLGSRFYASVTTAGWTRDQAVPSVQTIQLRASRAGGDLDLPGDVQPFTNAPIYAQVSGTVRKWYVDIGGRVKTGDLLAQIDPRPFEAALAQAQGQLGRDSATLANARVDLTRYQALATQNAVSAQQLAAQQTAVDADSGIVQADRAQVQTASINLGYTRISAPFGGLVTSRSVDVGNLVTVGTAAATPLFTVTDQTRLRIYVRMPQVYLSGITPDMTVEFSVPEYPGRSFTAELAATAGAVASSSGTQLLQFQIDNKDGVLKPGDYAEMHFRFPASRGVMRVPATALLFRDEGMMVAVVDAGNHVRIKPIDIKTDLGNAVEATGLSSADRVIDNPPDSLRAGDEVKPSPEPEIKKAKEE
jgi:RND family efflux transporter MFP subunit